MFKKHVHLILHDHIATNNTSHITKKRALKYRLALPESGRADIVFTFKVNYFGGTLSVVNYMHILVLWILTFSLLGEISWWG